MSPRPLDASATDPPPALPCPAHEGTLGASCGILAARFEAPPEYEPTPDPLLVYLGRSFPEPARLGRPGDRGWAGRAYSYTGRLAPAPLAREGVAGDLAAALAELPGTAERRALAREAGEKRRRAGA